MIYTLTCNPAVDYVIHTDPIRLGEVNRSGAEEIYFGGKGINVSAVLAQLGVASKALGFAAGFTGTAIEQGVRDMGIETDFIHLPSGCSRINVKVKADEETEFNGAGPAIDDASLATLYEKLDALTDGDTLVLAGSIPRSLPADFYAGILKRLSGRNVRAVVDATGSTLLETLPYRPFLIKPNQYELGEIFGHIPESDEEIAGQAAGLQERGARNVLVSMAGAGALLLDENGVRHRCGVCKGRVRNSVGAGDSMVAGFLAGCSKGDYGYALRLGTAAGGATAFSEGLAARDLIDELMGQLQQQEVL